MHSECACCAAEVPASELSAPFKDDPGERLCDECVARLERKPTWSAPKLSQLTPTVRPPAFARAS